MATRQSAIPIAWRGQRRQWRFIEITVVPPATGTDPLISLNVSEWPRGGTGRTPP